MKVTSLRYLDAKFHRPSLGASPPNRGNRISCVQNSPKTENRNSVNNSGIGILCSKNSNERLAFPAVAGLLVFHLCCNLMYCGEAAEWMNLLLLCHIVLDRHLSQLYVL